MKKSLLTLSLAAIALCANAQEEPIFNFFDPADCDAEGWLWLDTQEKIDKYVGPGKKIQLVSAQYEVQDEIFGDEYFYPESYADPDIIGFNKLGEEGGEGAKTGGLVLPKGLWGEWDDFLGGGFMVAMPDCALFEVFMSQADADIFTELHGALFETDDPEDCYFIWFYGPDWWTETYIPLSSEYVAVDDLTNPEYVYVKEGSYLDGTEDVTYMIPGEKGCGGRTAYYSNYGDKSDLIIHGFRVQTYTNTVDDTAVKAIAADALNAKVNNGIITLSQPAQISVFTPAGVKVDSAYGTSLDCSALKGIYLVKAGNRTLKVRF